MNKFSPTYKQAILSENSTLKECLKLITKSGLLIACISSFQNERFLGILTDSDIRRALLNGASLDDSIEKWINRNPVTANVNSASDELFELSHRVGKREIPLLDDQGFLVDIFILGLNDIRTSQIKQKYVEIKNQVSNYMFILAGGLGTRLRSIVNDRPKPLAIVGGKPIIETLLNQASSQGIKNFYISTNYLAEQIEEFLSSERFSELNIEFVKEKQPLGTAGSIGFIKNKIKESIIVCNADILTNVQYLKIIEEHEKQNADITCAVRPYQYTVPYGVIDVMDKKISSINEKPKFNFLVNTGIYVLKPKIIELIENDQYLNMTDFITKCNTRGKKIIPYLIHEYWIDVGLPEEYLKANDEYHLHFES
ncbi:nucleotidyltransferase family protein [Silvanigrella sp.]|jgi:dTDP-glucose pyrophosphorylase|uniref:nucleotidyltransferase family protein n=1 Tax=Silvanigrella sp. TaxID=2024976 RepID=UPI0037C849A2|nr:nucleotidyltransferase family protein [Silvanigrellaceae bacterium]